MSDIELIPVLDLMGGQVVRGIAGQRESYQPNRSVLTNSVSPLETAQAISGHFGCRRFYVADLDAILGRGHHRDAITQLTAHGFRILLDAGIASVEDLAQWKVIGCDIVIGLETLRSWSDLQELAESPFGTQLTFSLDLKHGQPLGELGKNLSARGVFDEAFRRGITRYIVLDLSAVGVSQGIPTLELCRELKSAAPNVELITGGGVRNWDDVASTHEHGASGVLIASAIHDGRLVPKPSVD